jgi:hypothetical protein
MTEFLLHVVLELACGMTGRFLLRALTFGGWDVADGRDSVAEVVGVLFWLVFGVGVWFAVFR